MKQKMWAWYNYRDSLFWHIYPQRFLVEMCSPDGYKSAEKNGEGKIVEVEVRTIEAHEGNKRRKDG